MKKVVLALILGLVFVACSPEKKYADELAEIDQYEKSLDSLGDVYSTIKFDSLIIIHKMASESEKMVKSYYNADTISMDLGQQLQFIKSVRKSLNNIEISRDAIKNELETLKVQFKNLESDTKNGILSREQIKTYIKEEASALNTVEMNISNLLLNQTRQFRDFYYAYPFVTDYIEQIKPVEQ